MKIPYNSEKNYVLCKHIFSHPPYHSETHISLKLSPYMTAYAITNILVYLTYNYDKKMFGDFKNTSVWLVQFNEDLSVQIIK